MTPTELFHQYIQNGLYLRGWSQGTAVIYARAWKSFTDAGTDEFNKANLEAWIVKRRQANMSPAGINIYIRAMNSFSAWLKEEGHASEAIVLKQLKAPLKPITVFSDQDIKRITHYKPSFMERRTWHLLQLLLDTGCRINELLTLKYPQVDLENMLLTVEGKGSKTRKVPISIEGRKVLFRQTKNAPISNYVFCSRGGTKLMYRNVYRDLKRICKKIGISKRVHPHLTRHTFACHFMKNGGSIYSLSRMLGHSSVSTTQTYVRGLGIEDFQEEHAKMSPLSRLRGDS